MGPHSRKSGDAVIMKGERRGEFRIGRFRVGWTLFETPGFSLTFSIHFAKAKRPKECHKNAILIGGNE